MILILLNFYKESLKVFDICILFCYLFLKKTDSKNKTGQLNQ